MQHIDTTTAMVATNNRNNGRHRRAPTTVAPSLSLPHLFWSSLRYQTKEFFNNSTLHGVRYIAEEGRPFAERFMWFCFTVSGAVAAFIIIVNLWEKFQTNPTITGLDTDFHNQQVIFPTVSVCPTVPYNVSRTRELAMQTANNDENSADRIEAVLQALTSLTFGMFAQLAQTKLTAGEMKVYFKRPLRHYAFAAKVECADVFDGCRYKDEDMPCCELFYPVYTEHGLCYAFNGRFTDTPTAELRNESFHDLFETDKKWSLYFVPQQRARIFVHSHAENFGYDFRAQFEWVPPFSTELLISMKQTYTTEDARQLSIVQRKCIFPDELRLSIYDDDEYTFTSCMKECRVRKSVQFCHCVPPFYRPLPDLAPYCGLQDFKCLSKYVANITDVRDCKRCELSCSNTVYDIEKLSENGGEQGAGGSTDESYVNIEYLTWPIIRYKREVLFGWVDLLVSFGGIAGLFLGFSLLSGVEIVYYFTMRACCMVYKNRDVLYAVEEEKRRRKLGVSAPVQHDRDIVQVIPMHGPMESSPDISLQKRVNRANMKLQAARELAKARFEQSNKVAPDNHVARTTFLETGQFGYIP